MEYVYGTSVIGGVERENLKIVGGPALREGEVRPRCGSTTTAAHDRIASTGTITATRTRTDAVRLLYHQRALPVCGKDKGDGRNEKSNEEIAFVTLAESGSIDAVTAGSIRACLKRGADRRCLHGGAATQLGDKLAYKCVQAHTSQAGWEPDKAVSLWSAASTRGRMAGMEPASGGA